MVEESLSHGFRFVERLMREYRSGLNFFDKSGEVLLTASVQGAVVGIGGLNRDPYFNDFLIVGNILSIFAIASKVTAARI